MTSAPTYADHDVTVGGLKLHYQEWGDAKAPPILMLHGFGVSGHMFDEFADRVKDRYRLIALDQRGHGDSDWSEPGDYSRDAFVDDVEGFRKELKLENFILVGHSMGGLNAVSYTARHPERVTALVLVDVGPEAAKDGVDNIIRFTRGPDELEFEQFVEMAHQFNQRRTIENIRERMRHRLKPSESGKYTWKFDKRFRQPESPLRVGSEMTNDEVWQLYRDIRVPTLLVRGAESDVLTQDTAERAVREMRRARLKVVAGAGHSVPGDNPDDFSAVVTEFLTDVEHGRFGPDVSVDLPPLERLVTATDRRRQSPGAGAIIAAAAGAVVVIGLSAWLLKSLFGSKKAAKRKLPDVDIADTASRRADLATSLGQAGARGAQQAVSAIREADLGAKATPLAQAAEPIVKKAREKARPRKKRSKIGTAMTIGRYAIVGARLVGAARKRQARGRGRTGHRRRGLLRR